MTEQDEASSSIITFSSKSTVKFLKPLDPILVSIVVPTVVSIFVPTVVPIVVLIVVPMWVRNQSSSIS